MVPAQRVEGRKPASHCKSCHEEDGTGGIKEGETDSGRAGDYGRVFAGMLGGTPPDIVMVQGRWASARSFVLYWRKIEEILPSLFVSHFCY